MPSHFTVAADSCEATLECAWLKNCSVGLKPSKDDACVASEMNRKLKCKLGANWVRTDGEKQPKKEGKTKDSSHLRHGLIPRSRKEKLLARLDALYGHHGYLSCAKASALTRGPCLPSAPLVKSGALRR